MSSYMRITHKIYSLRCMFWVFTHGESVRKIGIRCHQRLRQQAIIDEASWLATFAAVDFSACPAQSRFLCVRVERLRENSRGLKSQ